jgi:tetratricopeptide (TPR) repeat protein
MGSDARSLALDLLRKAYQLQMQGELELAITLYRRSIEILPTAEAHTLLGRAYRSQDRLEDAIVECRSAIEIDPTFGNPYNDIGAYLIELDRLDEAIGWLEQATRSQRYESFQYPWFHLGRIYVRKELYRKALECFEQALDIAPDYEPAQEAAARVRRLIQ